jgi:hypothetical protein
MIPAATTEQPPPCPIKEHSLPRLGDTILPRDHVIPLVIRAPVVSIGDVWAEIARRIQSGLPAVVGMRWQLNGRQASPILSAAPVGGVRAVLIEPEISTTSVVLVGSLNPTIFTPDWFARHGLLSDKEAESARVDSAPLFIWATEDG